MKCLPGCACKRHTVVMTEEHKAKIAAALKGKVRSPEHSEAISKAKLGVPKTHGKCAKGTGDILAYQREWRAKNREKCRFYEIKRRYNKTEAEYAEMMASQEGKCKVCKRPFTAKRLPELDHDHRCCPGAVSCGKCVRGLLCQACNKKVTVADRIREYTESVHASQRSV